MKAEDPRILSAYLLIFIWIVLIRALTLITPLNIGSKISNYSTGEERILTSWNSSSQAGENTSHTDVLTGVYLNRILRFL